MMNRSTKRELIKLLLQFSETLPQIDFGADEQKNMALDILETVAGKCRQDFSKAVAAKYADTMQALSQIIQTTDWHCQSQDENIQCHTLCQEIILQLVENLRHEKEIKKDIVFLPYKASMWDSLESVWKAAYEDKEHCNAYVIPIPYADLNPDRSVAAWHCERDQYPKYVPTLDWREVDLEKWHPDIIFIHNPYDNYNYITSVESRYYAQNLKHCTNKLVYIPYFVLDEPCTEESVEHFVLTAGVLNADEVIVQSEAMRELYIRILTKKTEQTARTYWEKRISGAGSPKIEKVLTSKKEDFEMPEKWQKLVEGKKVILYNTSLSAMLQNSDKVCDKLRYVFDVFRNRDDVVLWWRPHPLMKSTFHSMRPQYEAEYLSLEKQYIEEGWGIYDDSSDLHRAICWSDAYYGDASSVVWMYKRTAKKVLIQDLQSRSYAPYWFYDVIEDKERNQFVFKSPATECLYTVEMDSGKLLKECFLKDRRFYSVENWKWNHSMMTSIGDKLLIYPCMDNKWYIYKKQTSEMETIYIDDKEALNLRGKIEYRGNVYFWNERLQLWMYDSIKERIEKKGEWNSVIGGKISMPIANAGVILDDVLYIPLGCDRYVLLINMKRLTANIENIGEGIGRYINVTTDGENIFLLKDRGGFVKYNVKNKKIDEYKIFSDYRSDIEMFFGYIFCINKINIILFPCDEVQQSVDVIVFSLKKMNIVRSEKLNWGYVFCKQIAKEYIMSIDRYKNEINVYNEKGENCRSYKIIIDKKLIQDWKHFFFKESSKILNEICDGNIIDMIHSLENKTGYLDITSRAKQSLGKEVYSLVIS